jgi:hypothetical protein
MPSAIPRMCRSERPGRAATSKSVSSAVEAAKNVALTSPNTVTGSSNATEVLHGWAAGKTPWIMVAPPAVGTGSKGVVVVFDGAAGCRSVLQRPVRAEGPGAVAARRRQLIKTAPLVFAHETEQHGRDVVEPLGFALEHGVEPGRLEPGKITQTVHHPPAVSC